MAALNVGGAIALYLLVSTAACVSLLPPRGATPLACSLLFFNNLNVFIAICEIFLGFNVARIRRDYLALRSKHEGRERDACLAYLLAPLRPRDLLTAGPWCGMWSAYSLYDPSYSNRESFGFFVDFGNGLSTIPPSLLVSIAIVRPERVSPLWAGCVGLAMYWQVMYGTIIYILSFLFNRRHEGKSLLEVCLFVGVSNSLWFVFPIAGIYACVHMLRDGSMGVLQK